MLFCLRAAAPPLIGAGSMGADAVGTTKGAQTYQPTTTRRVATAQLGGHFDVGLLISESFGSGFTSLTFTTAVNGVQVGPAQSFTTLGVPTLASLRIRTRRRGPTRSA